MFAAALALCATACGNASTRTAPASSATRVAGPTTAAHAPLLPRFSDWRVAYAGQDGALHAVTLDGRTDLAGPKLTGLANHLLPVSTAGSSPNGHLLAYVGAEGLQVLDTTNQIDTSRLDGGGAAELYWSPDGSQLALSGGYSGIAVERISDGRVRFMPTASFQAQRIGDVCGWTDSTHLAVQIIPTTPSQGGPAATESLGVLDVTTWQTRVVASVSSPALNIVRCVLSPDSAYALCFNRQYLDDPFTPLADLIDIRTGAVTPLPRIAALLSGGFGFTSAAWKPGAQTLMVSIGYGNGGVWLLDLGQDTAAQLPIDPQSAVTYPVGWAPDGSYAVLSSGWEAHAGAGPYELEAVTLGSQGTTATSMLTADAMSFPFLGFVRTA